MTLTDPGRLYQDATRGRTPLEQARAAANGKAQEEGRPPEFTDDALALDFADRNAVLAWMTIARPETPPPSQKSQTCLRHGPSGPISQANMSEVRSDSRKPWKPEALSTVAP
jgi:hypothetical protein